MNMCVRTEHPTYFSMNNKECPMSECPASNSDKRAVSERSERLVGSKL